jgi:glycosyltransferase involved in cell wall biosynthesis
VQVLVLRSEALYDHPGYKEALDGFKFRGEFVVPHLPQVKAFQEILPGSRGIDLVRRYHKLVRPWVKQPYDVVLTKIGQFHAYFCWRGKPVVYELSDLPVCIYGNHNNCRRNRWGCSTCRQDGGLRWQIQDFLRMRLYRRFDLFVGDELMIGDLKKVGLHERGHVVRFMVDRGQMHRPLVAAREREQKALVDTLAGKHKFVLMQFNRLVDFKNPQLLLDIAEHLPECGIVFAGDGTARARLEERVNSTPGLRGRVVFLGSVVAEHIGCIAERVSGFVMTSTLSNHNISLVEMMGLGIAPVIAVDTQDFPERFDTEDVIFKIPREPVQAARQIQRWLNDAARCRSVTSSAAAYVTAYHSQDQMWAYRERLLELTARYSS